MLKSVHVVKEHIHACQMDFVGIQYGIMLFEVCFAETYCVSAKNLSGSCTLKSWNDPACPQFCVDNDPSQKGSLGDMRQCNDGNTYWVCGMNATDCSNAFTLPKTYVDDSRAKNLTNIIAAGPSASGASAASGTVTTTVLVTVTASASSTNSPTSSTSPLAAGVGAGLGVGIPLLIALAATIFLLRKAKRENKLLIAGQGQPLQNFNSQEHHKNGPFIHEAPEKSHGSADRFLVHEAPAMEGHR